MKSTAAGILGPRPYQRVAINRIHKIMELPERKAFLQMPTGTGKTYSALVFSIEHCQKHDCVSVIWIVHQTNLYVQSAQDFLQDFQKFGGSLDCDIINGEIQLKNRNDIGGELNGITYHFMTWQKLTRMLEAGEIEKGEYDLLLLDEAHYGSSENQLNQHSSFKKIFTSKLFPFHLYISATLWDLNPAVYPGLVSPTTKKVYAKFLSMYTTKEASRDGRLNEVMLYSITSADTIKLKKILNDETIEVEGDTKSLSTIMKNKKVDLKNVNSRKTLYRAITSTLIKTFLTKEDPKKKGTLPPTIVFCNGVNRKMAGDDTFDPRTLEVVKKMFQKALANHYNKAGNHLIKSVTGEDADSLSTLNDFAKGKFPILLVANMAQEGFNYPALEVAIDLNPNYGNTKRWNQKMGRLTRTLPSKPASRYYYADVVTNYIDVNGIKKNANRDSEALNEMVKHTNPNLSDAEVPEVAETLGNMSILAHNTEQDETGIEKDSISLNLKSIEKLEISESDDTLSKLNIKKTAVTLTSVGYIITGTEKKTGDKYDRCVKLSEVIESSGDQIPWAKIPKAIAEKMIHEHMTKGTDLKVLVEKYV